MAVTNHYYITQSGHYGQLVSDKVQDFDANQLTAEQWEIFEALPDGARFDYITELKAGN